MGGTDLSPAKALAWLKTLHRADIVLPTTDGREIRLRRITEPSEEQNKRLHQLGLPLPHDRGGNFERIQNVVKT